ncbi:MAG TPA: hypothetical protein DHU63_06805 [Candidatus Marinimicrobia bacterium]|nr:hypothetical protein [Candidatus Neomarinimicrobiota bacterium]
MTRNQDLLRRIRHFPSGKDFKDGMKAGLAPINQFPPRATGAKLVYAFVFILPPRSLCPCFLFYLRLCGYELKSCKSGVFRLSRMG